MCLGRSTVDSGTMHWFGLTALLTFVYFINLSSSQPDLNQDDVIIRLGYGVVASKLRSVCVVNGYWEHLFHFRLPARPIKQSYRSVINSTLCDSQCSQLAALQSATGNLTQVMRDSIRRSINHIYTLTGRERPLAVNRKIRSTNWLGYGINWISGVATEDQLDEFREVIRTVKEASDVSASDSARTLKKIKC